MARAWNRFFRQCQRDLRLWLFMMAGLTLFRVVFILVFRQRIGQEWVGSNVLAALLNGLRFDAMVSTYWISVPFAASVLCAFWDLERAADVLRKVFAAAYLVVTPLICCISVEYFREYDDVFNHVLFTFFTDDTAAVLTTIYSEYGLIPYLLLSGALSGVALIVWRRYFTGEFVSEDVFGRFTSSHLRRLAVSLLIAVMFVVGIRGSIGSRPAQMKDAGITSDRFLNKAVLNPYFALAEAAKVQLAMSGEGGLKLLLPDEDVAAALREVFPSAEPRANIDHYLRRTAAGPKNPPPRHIFLIGEESYDAWPLLEKYRPLGLTESLRRLAREGLHLKAFLPAGGGSMSSYTSIITGLPYVSGLERYARSATKPFPTSLAETMRRLGYRTRFFCGGYLSWCNVGDLSLRQGFQEIYGAGHMARWWRTNEWGVDDEFLFEFVVNTVTDDRPSFNFIMTSSYHPPYDLDLEGEGFRLKDVPPPLKPSFEYDARKMLRILGHLWYADRCLGEFVARAEKALSRPLFVVTGDHFGRRFINSKPTLFERSAVPLVLYGKEVLNGVRLPEGAAGSHIDIGPTLVELAAPKGFKYHAFGRNLLAPKDRFIGIASGRVIGADFVMQIGHKSEFHPIPGRELPEKLPRADSLKRLHDAVHGIAWWRVKRGPDLRQHVRVAAGRRVVHR